MTTDQDLEDMGLIMDWLIVDWLILVLVTPVVIVVVVLLYGFVGCGSFETATVPQPPQPPAPTKPDKPTELEAIAVGPTKIKLTWKHSAGGGVQFTLVRERKEGTPETKTYASLLDNTFTDTAGVQEATTYSYKVTAIVPGFSSDATDPYLVTTLPEAPFAVQAIAEELDRIDVKWGNMSNASDVIIKVKSGATSTEEQRPKGSGGPVPHTVPLGSTSEFQVFAVREGYRGGKDKQEIRSETKPAVVRKSLAFKTDLTTEQDPTLAGHCVVQRIASTLLFNSGKPIKLWLRGSTVGDLAIEKIYISQPDANGDAWDSDAATLKKVYDQPLQPLLLPASNPPTLQVLDLIDYDLDQTKELLIAFDIGASGRCRYNANLEGATTYYKATKQAATPNRDPAGYDTADKRHYLVDKIEVY